ncbi:major facilitator superfamily protein, partial [Kipferlia bialata]
EALLYICYGLFLLFGVLPAFTNTFWGLFFWRTMIGFPAGLAFPIIIDMMSQRFEPVQRTKVLGWCSLSLSSQGFVYSLLGGYLARTDYHLVFYVQLIIAPIMLFGYIVGPLKALPPSPSFSGSDIVLAPVSEESSRDAVAVEADLEADLEAALNAEDSDRQREPVCDVPPSPCAEAGYQNEHIEAHDTAEGVCEYDDVCDEVEVVVCPNCKGGAPMPVDTALSALEGSTPPFPLGSVVWYAAMYTLTQGTWYLLLVLSSLHLAEDLEIDDTFIAGVASASNTIGMMGGAAIVSAMVRHFPDAAGPMYFAIQATGILLGSTVNLYVVILGCVLCGVGAGGLLPLLLGKASSYHPSHTATAGSVFLAMQNTGMVVFPATVSLFSNSGDCLLFGGIVASIATLTWLVGEWKQIRTKRV